MSDTISDLPSTERARTSRRPSPLAQAVAGGFLGALLLAATAPMWRYANPTWRLTLPFVPHPGGKLFSTVAFFAGVSLLGFGWFRLSGVMIDTSRAESWRLRVAAKVMSLWALPIVLGPPLLSNDVYSYAAQGEIGSRGLDPTVVGPWALGGGRFWRAADDIWHDNPSPYGPIWNKLAAGVVQVTGHDPALAVWGFRVVILASVVLAAWAVVRLARRLGVNPAVALVLAIGNPVVLVHLIGGIHNDAMMMALLLTGLAFLRDRRRAVAFLALSAAVAIKLPAVVGLAYLGWMWRDDAASWFRRSVRAGLVTVAGFAFVMALSVQFSMSQGWVTALKGTGKVKSTFAPSTMTGRVAAAVLEWFHFQVNEDHVIDLFRTGGLLLAAAIGWYLLSNAHRIGTELAIGTTLFVTMLLGPVLWPWYMPPAIALLAVRGAEKVRPALAVCCIALAMFVLPTSAAGGGASGVTSAVLGIALLIALTVLAMVVQWLFGQPVLPAGWQARWHRWRAGRRREPATTASGSTIVLP
jgi:hypothetical protein